MTSTLHDAVHDEPLPAGLPLAAWAETGGLAAVAVAWRPEAAPAVVVAGVLAAAAAQAPAARRSRAFAVSLTAGLVALAVPALLDPYRAFAAPLVVFAATRELRSGRLRSTPRTIREAWSRALAAVVVAVLVAHAVAGHTASPRLTALAAVGLAALLAILMALCPDPGGEESVVYRAVARLGVLTAAACAVALLVTVLAVLLGTASVGLAPHLLTTALRPLTVTAASVLASAATAVKWLIALVFGSGHPHHQPALPPIRAAGEARRSNTPSIGTIIVASMIGAAVLLVGFMVTRRDLRRRRGTPHFADEPTFRERRRRLVGRPVAIRLRRVVRHRRAGAGRRWPRRGTNAERVRAVFARVLDAALEGRPPRPDLTAGSVALRIADQAPSAATSALQLARVYQAARYGRDDVDADAVHVAETAAARILTELAPKAVR